MKYTKEDIYLGFSFVNGKGKGKIYKIEVIGNTICHLVGVNTHYDNTTYSISNLLELLNSGLYVKEVPPEPTINNQYSII